MKKMIIGAIIGGLLLFIWQTLSWTALNLHSEQYQKTAAQDSILQFLGTQLKSDGHFMVPTVDPNASAEEIEKITADMKGKPWAVINYHSAYNVDMGSNILRGLLVDIIIAWLVCWILLGNPQPGFGRTYLSCLAIGLTGYLFLPYSEFMWYQTGGATQNLIDVLVSWSLCGVWLGWWLGRK